MEIDVKYNKSRYDELRRQSRIICERLQIKHTFLQWIKLMKQTETKTK